MEQSESDILLKRNPNNLCIRDFCTTDQEVFDFFSEIPVERRRIILETALKLGVTALKTMSTTEKVDYIEKNFKGMAREIKHEMEMAFGDNGKVRSLIEQYFGDKGHVEHYFETKIGKNGELMRMIEQQFGPNGDVVRNIFDPNRDGTPLFSLKKEIMDSILKMREDMGIKNAQEEVKEKTALKGADFESDLQSLLEGLAKPFGDIPRNVSTQPGLVSRSKKGDFVVELSSLGQRIVVEAKDSNYSFKKIEEEMKEAIENRDAPYGIFVSKYVEDLPDSVGWFNEYSGRFLVVALSSKNEPKLSESLAEIAYKWARIRVVSAGTSMEAEEKAIDIRDDIESIRKSISNFKRVRTYCTNAENALGSIREEIRGVEKEVLESLDNIIQETER